MGKVIVPTKTAIVAKAFPMHSNAMGLVHVKLCDKIVQHAVACVDNQKLIHITIEDPTLRLEPEGGTSSKTARFV